jgi:thiamine-phosphate pyrophosphorylase
LSGSEPDYSLYVVTDRELMNAPSLESAVEQAVRGGATLVQLREKTASSLEFYRTAVSVKRVTDSFGIPLIVNDRADIALAAGAAGLHVGQDDLPVPAARRLIGDGILGVSVSNVEEALSAQKDGADYLGVGAMFPTATKSDAEAVSMEELKRIRSAVSIPIVVIGGIHQKTVPLFRGTGIDGIAVVSAVMAAKDIQSAARELKELFLAAKEGTDR